MKPLHEKCRHFRKIWITQGRPRDPNNAFFCAYKHAKRDFRKQLRRKAYEYDSKEYEIFENIFEQDRGAFQRTMSTRRKDRGLQSYTLKINGKTIDDPNELREVWKDHYSDLYKLKYNSNFDANFTSYVENCLLDYEIESLNASYDALDVAFTLKEVSSTCAQLPNRKACGPDGLYYEHVKYGGQAVIKFLTGILNVIRVMEEIPNALAVGDIISLYKTNKKNRHNKDNYRGITLLNVVGKFFERLILNRWMPYFGEKGFPNNLQYAYQTGKSCLDATMSLQEAVLHNIENGSKVYGCFLDTAKAFDTVWISGLFYKMFNLGIQGKTWRLLRNWYSKLTSRVIFDGAPSSEFPILQGVRQGGVLSPWLFMIFNNDLPQVLNECNESLWLNNLRCNPILVADDIAILSTRVKGLQIMLNCLENYSFKWHFEFNPSKTTVITFGETTQIRNRLTNSRSWTLYGVPIKEKQSWPHVGIELSGNFSSLKRTLDACAKAKSTMACLSNLGLRHNALNPICGANLWRSVVIPTALYGCELWNNMTEKELLSIERSVRHSAKRIQGLEPNTRSEAALGSLVGLWSMEGQIDKAKLLYFGRLCLSSVTMTAKQIFVIRLFSYLANPTKQKLGFIPDIVHILNKYDLLDYLATFVHESIIPSKNKWRIIVQIQIKNYETEKWKNGMVYKEELFFFKEIHTNLTPLYLWELAKRNPCEKLSIVKLVKIICGNVPRIFHLWTTCDPTVRCTLCQAQIWNINFILL